MLEPQNSFFNNNVTAQLATFPKTSLSSSHTFFSPLLDTVELSNQQNLGFFLFLHIFPFKADCCPVLVSVSAVHCKKPGWFADTFSQFSLSTFLLRIPFISISPLRLVLEFLDMTLPQLSRLKQRSFCHICSTYWASLEMLNFLPFLILHLPVSDRMPFFLVESRDAWDQHWEPYTIWPSKIIFSTISYVCVACNILFVTCGNKRLVGMWTIHWGWWQTTPWLLSHQVLRVNHVPKEKLQDHSAEKGDWASSISSTSGNCTVLFSLVSNLGQLGLTECSEGVQNENSWITADSLEQWKTTASRNLHESS